MTVRMSDQTDHPLVVRAVENDGVALTTLLQRHDKVARGLAWRMVADPNGLDDVMQDAHLRVFRAIGRFDPDGPAAFSTWFCRIVFSSAADHRRAAARRPTAPLTSEPATAIDHTEQADWRDALRRGLLRLEPDVAAAVALVDGEGMTQQQAAEILQTSRDQIARRLAKGRRALKTYLTQQGVSL